MFLGWCDEEIPNFRGNEIMLDLRQQQVTDQSIANMRDMQTSYGIMIIGIAIENR
jgi:hypothetical protein